MENCDSVISIVAKVLKSARSVGRSRIPYLEREV
jgi:hypothetical protein